MVIGTHVLNIQDFLLTYALGPVGGIVDRSSAVISDAAGHPLTRADLRAEIERHSDRTITVVSMSRIETITRCGVCPKEDTRPCMALRVLALPYAPHPAYRTER